MEKSDKYRNLIWIVIFLAVLNVSTLVTIGFHVKQSKNNNAVVTENVKGNNQQNPNYNGKFFRDNLNLDDSQMNEFRRINSTFRQTARNINFELNSLRGKMLEEMRQSKPDTILLNQYSDSVGFLHAQLKKETFTFYLNFKSICKSDEQTKNLDIIFDKFLNTGNNQEKHGHQYGKGQGKGQNQINK